MIIDKIKNAAHYLGIEYDLTCVDDNKKIFGVIHNGKVTAMTVADSAFAPIEEPQLTISCYPEYAAGLYQNAPRPVWLYDRLEDIRDMRLPKPENPAWVILVAQMEDFVSANILADRWTDEYEVSVMVGEEKQMTSMFAANLRPIF